MAAGGANGNALPRAVPAPRVETEIIAPGRVPVSVYARFISAVTDYAIIFVDPEGRVSSWNGGAQRLLGYRPEEIVGKPISTFYPPTGLASKKPQIELRVARAEGRYEDEDWRVRKDGTMFWANVVVTALRDDEGTFLGFVKVTRDLTVRKHAEEALRASEERFRLLTRSVKDYAIFMLDTEGRIVSWNEGARALKGYEEDEIVGEHFSRFYLPADIARAHPQNELAIALREGRYEEEGWRLRKDGTRFWASVTITALFDSTSRHIGFAKVTRDLTLRKQAEEELRARADSYANLNRELDAFSHTVAHDLRSPIRAAEHLSSVLLEDEAERLSPEGRATLEALHKTSLSMARLVQDLLDLSTAAGRAPVRREVDVSALAHDIAREVLAYAEGREVDIRVQEGLTANADANLLRVAIANLLSNAVKFTRRAERARIEVGRAEDIEGRPFFVRDNGVGFDPSLAPQLFQPFARLHAVTEFEGTGIGLATVGRIVQRHGGRIWAESRPNEGATFYFTIPEARA